MASTMLKVSNRSAKAPIKKLPTSIEITPTTTVQDVREKLARASGVSDPNRLGIFDPVSKKTIKDRLSIVADNKDVMAGKEIFIKDLGPQLSWRGVFVVEYLGPIFIHIAIYALRPYIYPYTKLTPISTSQKLTLAMVLIHFIKREYETLFVHKFSLATMPFFNIFKNSGHYWLISGLNLAYWAYSPSSYATLSSPLVDYLNYAGLALFTYGEISNLMAHQTLSNLRSPGGTERGIPKGYGFNWVTCPNYLFEILSWVGVALVSKSLATVIFVIVSFAQMYSWAWKKEKALRTEFPDKYKKKRTVIIPGIC